MFLILLALQLATTTLAGDPFAFLEPSVTLTTAERDQLHRGQPIARVLPAEELEVAVLAAVPVNIDADRLVAWMRRIEELKKSSYVLAIRRFSNPPQIEDVADLTLDDADLSAARDCRPGNCGLKLSASEMTLLQTAAAGAGGDWKPAVQRAFRGVVLERARAYVARGEMAAYEDQSTPVWPATRFVALLEHSEFVGAHLPRLAEYLRGSPSTVAPGAESFLYWSKERLARKAVISVTQVSIVRTEDPGVPNVQVASREVFSAHYTNASFALTALVRGEPGRSNYLVYVNRSEADVLRGTLSGLIRWFLQRRLRSESANVLQSLRRRLESGAPPAAVAMAAP